MASRIALTTDAPPYPRAMRKPASKPTAIILGGAAVWPGGGVPSPTLRLRAEHGGARLFLAGGEVGGIIASGGGVGSIRPPRRR